MTAAEHLLARGGDWAQLLRSAEHEGLVGQLHSHLTEKGGGSAPPEFLKTLAGGTRFTAAYGAQLCHWAEAAAEALGREGFRTAALKGLALVETCYRGDTGLRPMIDADILAEDTAQARSREVLTGLGLEPIPGRQEAYACPGGGQLEVHYQCDHAFWDMKGLLERARPCGKPYLMPASEDLLIYAGLHAVFHKMRFRLIWLADAALMTRDPIRPLDWGRLLRLMEAHPGKAAMGRFLRAAVESCGAEVPAPVLDRLLEGGWRGRAVDWLLAHPNDWLEPLGTYTLGRHPSVPLRGLLEVLWPTGPRLTRRLGPGQSASGWRFGRPFQLVRLVPGMLASQLHGRAR